jgi:beta-carotene hydroxylase
MNRSGILRYSVDLWAVGLVAVVTGLISLPFLVPLTLWQLVLVGAAAAYLRTFCAFVQHNHAHLPIFRFGVLNVLFDAMLTQNTGYPTALWQLHHNLGHHRHFLSPDEDVAATNYPGTRVPMSRWVYAVRGNLTILRDAIRIGLREKAPKNRALLRKLVLEMLVQLAIIGALMMVNPLLTIFFFVIPSILTAFLIWWESYPHHLDMPTTSVFDASMTAESPTYNRLTFNIGHHTAHHQKPTLHWSLLPQQTAKIRHLIHRDCIKAEHTTAFTRQWAVWWRQRGLSP